MSRPQGPVRLGKQLVLMVGALLLGPPAAAEMSAEDYQAGARRLSPVELAREQARIEAERAEAERRDREREARAAQAQRQEEARRAARPAGERIVEARCGPCHGLDTLAAHAYGYAGWWVTVLRMEWLNGASIGAGERATIVEHLARTRPAPPSRVWVEWALAGALPLVLVLALWRIVRRRARLLR